MNPIRPRRLFKTIVAGSAAFLCLASSAARALPAEPEAVAAKVVRPFDVTEEREPCTDYVHTKRPLFGDLHVHTARSQDASTQDTRISPREAYLFARGESLGIQPYTEDGRPMRRVQLARPLDFAAVTDHAEQIGEVHICNTQDAEGYGSLACRMYRSFPRVSFFVFNGRYSMLGSRWGFCGEDAKLCYDAAGIVWKEHQTAAEEAYDRSASCEFTSLVAYEWTGAVNTGGHLHRNVVFRNENVPDLPISVMESGIDAINLWRGLDEKCRDGKPGCEVITIPHNSNWSSGSAFTSAEAAGSREEISAEEAPIRARYDRLVEMIQHKGESECAFYPGVNDEGCGFEKAPNTFATSGDPVEAVNFSRDALKRGLALESSLGVNPFAFGQIGSTDTHLGTPGLVAERGHPGHGGAGKPGNKVFDVPGLPDIATLNPGGLAVVWAEENSRDSIYAAMDQRETYATSGTRPELRLFGGWDFEPSLCDDPELAAKGYALGVPMGSALRTRPDSAGAPRLVVAATRDPHPNGGDLDQIEIVKGWVEDGETKEVVLKVVGGDSAADVDPLTCEPTAPGSKNLCTVWSDPAFDAKQPAFYYARLRETPSCRWTQWACIDTGISCDDPSTMREGYEYCCEDEITKSIQERAWSSPIWYRPESPAAPAEPTTPAQ